jgi:hypothetical protein
VRAARLRIQTNGVVKQYVLLVPTLDLWLPIGDCHLQIEAFGHESLATTVQVESNETPETAQEIEMKLL